MRIAMLLFLAFRGWAPATDVLTQHNDRARTGAVLDETQLDPKTLRGQHFGRLFSFAVDGQVYAQPLVVSSLQFPGKVRNVLYVATMRNWVYAFDADGDPALPLWSKHLGDPLPFNRIPKDAGAVLGQYNIKPYIGITSTPVIDRDRRRIYAVAKIADPRYPCPETDEASKDCPVVYRIYAFHLVTGDFVYRDITIPVPMPDHVPAVPAEDVARRHLQRPGLLLANGKIYAAFGSHQDAPPWQGWLIAFDADSLEQQQIFCSTPGGERGGIWQAGNGPAADGQGHIYMMIGNGSYRSSNQFGSKFVKLNPDLTPADWFAPANVAALNDLDIDLGSAGPMLIPGTDEMVGGGKQGKLYLVSQSKLGGQQRRHWPHAELNPPVQFFQASRRWRLTWISWLFPFLFHAGYHHIHGSPVYWNSAVNGPTVYVWPEEDNLKAYHYNPSAKFNTKPLKGIKGNEGMPGGFLSVSANGKENAILWASIPCEDDAWVKVVRGCLRAFDAATLLPLWSTDKDDPDDYFDFAKYVPPTIANGRVYLATFSDRVIVYGLHSTIGPPPSRLPKASRNPRHRGHVKGASGHSHAH